MQHRLERSNTHRMWAGVCGGIAEYFQVDPTLVRAFFIIATIFTGGLFLLVYVALLIIMPASDRPAAASGSPTDATAPVSAIPSDPATADRRREAAGWLLLALGVVFLLGNMGFLHDVTWRYIWPLALIAVGLYLVLQRGRR